MSSTYGFIYIMGSEAMPGIYKVGMTAHSPSRRAVELSRGTGVPSEYRVLFYGEHESAMAWERSVHANLDDRRVSENREFFHGPLIDIIHALEGDGELISSWDSDEAKEARNPGCMWRSRPLWFEQNLHSPGYIERARRERS
ncbi:GIY-YIG nuclease family protein [Pseudomonas soli]|uniref:GIY-YIG nuclease family protein n=1 Tax=Pseudomonas soli TaxID=1306993 RepID=UPI0003C7CE8E|nr:hypothetical protein O165_005470 [Pseudomonas soli]